MKAAPGTMQAVFGRRQLNIEFRTDDKEHIRIDVHPDSCVVVHAHHSTSSDAVKRFVTSRLRWINAQLEYFEELRPLPTPRNFSSGASHWHLGTQLFLKVKQGARPRVAISGQHLEVLTPETEDRELIRRQINNFQLREARRVFPQRFEALQTHINRIGVEVKQQGIRRMRTRWGSCTKDGTITLNTALIAAPPKCIDYVILHECAHLLEHKHSRKFFQLLAFLMPDWRDQRRRLDQFSID